MKKHKYELEHHNYGWKLYRCINCSCIIYDFSIDYGGDGGNYVDDGDWRVVSDDCDKAGKQIELWRIRDEKRKAV